MKAKIYDGEVEQRVETAHAQHNERRSFGGETQLHPITRLESFIEVNTQSNRTTEFYDMFFLPDRCR